EFATKFKLPIVPVIREIASSTSSPQAVPGTTVPGSQNPAPAVPGTVKQAFTGVGICVNSTTPDGSFSINGMNSDEAISKITDWLAQKGFGKKAVNYRLRDWLFSRQRYWGEPIPMVHVDGKPKPISVSELPLTLPEVKSYEPTGTGESPLAAIKEWVNVTVPGTTVPGSENPAPAVPGTVVVKAKRETNTMPQWAGSCWYYLRYLDPQNGSVLIDPKKEKYWMAVDLYVGGAEHAVLHLLYARFWHKVLYDCGVVSTKEPFLRLVNQGMILGEDNQKMSKSRGNVVNPDDIVRAYGADSVRLYEMFMGPLEMVKPWSTKGVEGVYRFLGRVWRLVTERAVPGTTVPGSENPAPAVPGTEEEENRILHRAIKKVTEDIEELKFHTAISALMIFVNDITKLKVCSKETIETFILLLAPFAPHISEELWQRLGHEKSLAYESWPSYNETYLLQNEVEIVIQVLGKIRSRMVVPKGLREAELKEKVLADENVAKWMNAKPVKKFIVVPDRLINIII
ncbi:MAG: leucine--tRNA ligase, partial [Candidatus Omnitrophica bacterium]|nr:leucine--tRNA ligase [Candidatus Omnitrophota bacterium]